MPTSTEGGRAGAGAVGVGRWVLLCTLLSAVACEDLIRAGRAAPEGPGEAAPAPVGDATPAGAAAPATASDGAPDLLGAPAWEGERSGVAEELSGIFTDEGLEGVIVVHDLRSGATLRSDSLRAARRIPPGATFEILGALVALEAGAVEGVFDAIGPGPEGEGSPAGADGDPPTLASAFRASSTADFVELTRRVGPDGVAAWVRRTGYGNGEVGGSAGPFWVDGPLEISPDEQIGFLRRLHAGRLPFSSRSLDAVRQLMLLDRGPDWALRGKTAWHRTGRTDQLWFVGWAEREDEAAFFVIEFRNESPTRDVPILRERIYRRALTRLGLVPQG